MSGKEIGATQLATFDRNLKMLSVAHQNDDSKFHLRVQLDRYSTNNDSIAHIQALAENLGIRSIITRGYPNPYDRILTCLTDSKSGCLDEIASNLTWSFEEYLDEARTSELKTCLCQRIFPVVDVTGAARNCHLYTDFILAENFLNVSLLTLEDKRRDNTNCRKCQSLGLQRLDLENIDSHLRLEQIHHK
jgi:hypothetical protein